MEQNMFSSEVELGNFLGSIDVIPDAHQAILATSSTYELHRSPSGYLVLAFQCTPNYTARFLNGEFDLVSSENLKAHDFISTKVNPSFSINEAAVDLFEHLSVELSQIENEVINSPLVVTGQSLGGYLAILFALRLQHAVDVKESNDSWDSKRPICITFGSPLVGDEALQRAISERPRWKSCFLNVVAKTDPVASLFSSKSGYRPFGTFQFCTDSGGHTNFEDQDSVLAVLDAMASSSAGNMEMHNYGNDLSSMRKKVLYRGVSELGEFNSNPLRAGITLQLKEVGMLDNQENNSTNDLIKGIEKRQTNLITRQRNKYDETKKLNDSKINLVHMELYMMTRRSKEGYYDSYKNAQSKGSKEQVSHSEIVKCQRSLDQCWKEFVEKKDRMPQKVGAKLRKRWLYGGTPYRRIVEPLGIAYYYKKGNKNYIKNRPNHYKLLENWSNQDKKDLNPSDRKNKAASLTEDSCFWAHVEEALISLRALKDGVLSSSSNAANIEQGLERFEGYVMHAINDYSLSPDVFLEESSLMKWWREYKAYKGSSYASEFAQYMNKKNYKSYQ